MNMKKIGTCYYIHKNNIQELIDKLDNDPYKSDIIHLVEFRKQKGATPYEVIKYDTKKHQLSMIDSPDWNTSLEPIVGDAWIYNFEKKTQTFRSGRTSNPQIYHSKELFCNDDYTGFDMEAAKHRTKEWNSVPEIKEVKKLIGNKDFWVMWCTEHDLCV